jgi:hypothetical protein
MAENVPEDFDFRTRVSTSLLTLSVTRGMLAGVWQAVYPAKSTLINALARYCFSAFATSQIPKDVPDSFADFFTLAIT